MSEQDSQLVFYIRISESARGAAWHQATGEQSTRYLYDGHESEGHRVLRHNPVRSTGLGCTRRRGPVRSFDSSSVNARHGPVRIHQRALESATTSFSATTRRTETSMRVRSAMSRPPGHVPRVSSGLAAARRMRRAESDGTRQASRARGLRAPPIGQGRPLARASRGRLQLHVFRLRRDRRRRRARGDRTPRRVRTSRSPSRG
jgi:hypothetical protein